MTGAGRKFFPAGFRIFYFAVQAIGSFGPVVEPVKEIADHRVVPRLVGLDP
jgi:hypothetical protein